MTAEKNIESYLSPATFIVASNPTAEATSQRLGQSELWSGEYPEYFKNTKRKQGTHERTV